MIFLTIFKTVAILLGLLFGWFFGTIDGFLYALLTFICVNFVTLTMRGILQKPLRKFINAQYLCGRIVIFLLVGVAHVIDANIIGTGDAVRNAVIFFYISSEGVAILSNATALGLPVPQKLRQILLNIQNWS